MLSPTRRSRVVSLAARALLQTKLTPPFVLYVIHNFNTPNLQQCTLHGYDLAYLVYESFDVDIRQESHYNPNRFRQQL